MIVGSTGRMNCYCAEIAGKGKRARKTLIVATGTCEDDHFWLTPTQFNESCDWHRSFGVCAVENELAEP